MKIKIPTPKSMHDDNKPFIYSDKMCGTCAYKVPATPEEIEFERSINRSCPHLCHERPNVYCKGSALFMKQIKE